ncbi:MAG: glucuronate isomerase [Chitinophagaceae bacterium]
MKQFLNQDFLLNSATAISLYHDYAKQMPIIDYHNHLPPDQVANDIQFKNITQAWLYGDHYKWRAMRTNGISEVYCTGNATDYEKFEKWAATVPYTVRNPLFHWTHLELQRYFNEYQLLNSNTCKSIYENCSEQIQQKVFSTKGLLKKMNVQKICTTDDPIDSLEHHIQLRKQSSDVKMYPAFRPDNVMNVADVSKWNTYINKLEAVTNINIATYTLLVEAMAKRHQFFHDNGCRIADHGLEEIQAENFTATEVEAIFIQLRLGNEISELDKRKFRSAIHLQIAEWNAEKGWVQQLHLGALRNNNARMLQQIGADTGWDSIGDFSQAKALSKFLNTLDAKQKLAKTIIYNLNPADNEVMATMIGNFNDGSVAGKVQYGAAWWFLDQKEGILNQLDALSSMGLVSKFVGMLTDSRSFLSFPRHEYFRRLLCNVFGSEIEKGELPNDMNLIGGIIQDICYNNTLRYFDWGENDAV